MNGKKRFWVTLFGGWFGLHKYMDGKIGIGVLYTLTLGLLYIGWLHDCVVAFSRRNITSLSHAETLHWQSLVMANTPPNKLVVNHKQLCQASQMYLDNNTRILEDCLRLVRETSSPDVYFKRLSMASECYNNLADLSNFWRWNWAISPTDALHSFESQEHDLTHNFIQRYWIKMLEEADKLKTEAARDKRKIKARETLSKYIDEVDSQNASYINQLE